MFSTPLGHFDVLFVKETAKVFSKMAIGDQIQWTLNIYIILTNEKARKIYNKDRPETLQEKFKPL